MCIKNPNQPYIHCIQLENPKASCIILIKVPLRTKILIKAKYIGFKNCSFLYDAMEKSNFSQQANQTWRFRREQAQTDINRVLGYLKKNEHVKCQIRFLQKCNKQRIIPKGLRSTLLPEILENPP